MRLDVNRDDHETVNSPVYAAVDVHYLPIDGARAALVAADDSAFSTIVSERTVLVPHVAPYQPGAFFRRELPPLRAVLDGVSGLRLLVVDGYVDLDPSGRPGLGRDAPATVGVPVIGVAKTRFASATHAVPVLRGQATRSLYVTAAGMPAAEAAEMVRAMAGRFRLPDALRRVDALARGRAVPATVTVSGPEP